MFSGTSVVHATHEPDGCDVNDNACMAHLNADVVNSNADALGILGVVVLVGVGVGVWALMKSRKDSDQETNQFVAQLKSGKGLGLTEKESNFRVSLFPNAAGSYRQFDAEQFQTIDMNMNRDSSLDMVKPKAIVGLEYKF